MDTNEIMLMKPKKRIFLALVLCSTVLTAIILYMVWKVTGPGLNSINAWLPALFGLSVLLFIVALFLGEVGIVLGILGLPVLKPV